MNPLQRAVQRMPGTGIKQFTLPQLLPAYKSGVPMPTDFNTEKGIKEGYKASATVYMCVRLLMQSAASLPWYVMTRKSVGAEWEPSPGHPLELLMESPNPFMTRRDLVERLMSHLGLGGNGLWSMIPGKPRGGGREVPVELWPINPGPVKPVPSTAEFITRYEYRDGDNKKDLDPKWIVHMMLTDPSNPYWGMSPLQAAARLVDTEVEAVRWNQVSLQNRAVTDGVFSFKQALTREQFEEAREVVRQQFQGKDNVRMPWVMGSEAQYHPMSLTPVEMDFIEGKRMTREDICGVYQTPLPLVVAQNDTTYANYPTARKAYWGETVIPIMDGVRGALNRRLVPFFGKPELTWLTFDTSQVEALREDLGAKIDQAQKLTNMGVPLNVAIQRVELDIDPVPGGDVGLVPSSMVPIELAGATDPELYEDPDAVNTEATRTQVSLAASAEGLNGAQVTALVNIVLQVAQDALPVNAASAIIQAAFPNLDAAAIKRILAGVPGYGVDDTPPKPAPALPPAPVAA